MVIIAIICAVVGILLGAGGYYLIARMAGISVLKKAEEEAAKESVYAKQGKALQTASKSSSQKKLQPAKKSKKHK